MKQPPLDSETLLMTLKHAPNEPSQRSLAGQLGFSVGKTNYVLKAVMAKGLIKAERFVCSDNKLAYRYVLTANGVQERIRLTETFIQRKKQEYEQLTAELEKLRRQHGQ